MVLNSDTETLLENGLFKICMVFKMNCDSLLSLSLSLSLSVCVCVCVCACVCVCVVIHVYCVYISDWLKSTVSQMLG